MYKLLLATNDQAVRDAFSAVAWENLGFKQPRMAATVEEALASYTAEGAYASFEEDFKGRLQPGMVADFTILSDNPFAVAPQTLHAIRAVETWMDGKKVFG